MDNQFESEMAGLINKYRLNNQAYADMMKRIDGMRQQMAALEADRKKLIDELRVIRDSERTLMNQMRASGMTDADVKACVDGLVKKMAEDVK